MSEEENTECENLDTERMDSLLDERLTPELKQYLCSLAAGAMNGDRELTDHLEYEINNIAYEVTKGMGVSRSDFLFNFVSQEMKMKILNKIWPAERMVNWMKHQARTFAKELSKVGAKEITITGGIGFASVSVSFDVKSLTKSS